MTELTARELLIMLYQTAIDSVDGRYLVNQWCKSQSYQNEDVSRKVQSFSHCVAIGKAAPAMLDGALDQISSIQQSLLICPAEKLSRKHRKNRTITCVASSHPVPDETSLQAATHLVSFLSALSPTDKVLFLISGGTSSLVELPVEGIELDDLQQINRYLLASGKDIHEMNAWRQQFSQIKAGGLNQFLKSSATQLLLSDVKGDEAQFIGSGLLVHSDAQPQQDDFLKKYRNMAQSRDMRTSNVNLNKSDLVANVTTHIIGNIALAKEAVHQAALSESLDSYVYEDFLEGDVLQVAADLFEKLKDAPAGIHIWGGETTVRLPDNPGVGGRNQALALAFSQYIGDRPELHLLAAGTDGVDGNSNSAGAVVSMYTSQKAERMGLDIKQTLEKANSGVLLMATDDLVRAEISNTNVMDIVIAYKTAS